jgi:tetratricopeptide (TPR) repeat protein
MPEWLLLLAGLVAAGALVMWPLRRDAARAARTDDAHEAAALRHRAALDALRDVEVDRRAGSLDDDAYARQLEEAEARAAATSAALDAAPTVTEEPRPGRAMARGAVFTAALIGGAILVGAALPAAGVANRTVENEALADARAEETARQEQIAALLEALAVDSSDPETLSDLADAYLAGSADDDLVRAAVALRVLIEIEPERADAYERIITAYLRAGDAANARAALDAYESIDSANPVEVAFFDGLIALRGEDDPDAAVEAFDRFLDLAPDDPRAGMIRGLRDEAAE